MAKTNLSVSGEQFLVNGKPTYSEIPGSNMQAHGLLFNQRMIQGIFDDRGNRKRYKRGGMGFFDPDANTEALVAALPQWHAYGLRAITVGLQGGWPVGMVDVEEIENNPFRENGKEIDQAYLKRLDRIVKAADELGMVVIVNILYWAQTKKFRTGLEIRNAVISACRFLRDKGYGNVIVDVANEYNIDLFADHALVNDPEGMASLIGLARCESGNMPVGSSGGGGMMDEEVVRASDVILIHGNGLSRGKYYDFVKRIKACAPGKPIVCNEDSPCCTRVDVSLSAGVSWGYYNNYTKQIPPCNYGISPGEDLFFARRVARAVGIPISPLEQSEQYLLQGGEEQELFGDGLRCFRLASEFPETIDFVRYYYNGELAYVSYDEPFFFDTEETWLGRSFAMGSGDEIVAEVHLVNGETFTRSCRQQ